MTAMTKPAAGRPNLRPDFNRNPFIVFWEITRSCDLACKHCRACAQTERHPNELTTEGAIDLLRDLRRFEQPPFVVVTGGDPMKRDDVFHLVRAGTHLGLKMGMAASATQLITAEALIKLRDSGLHRLALSLDGADAQTHDAFRGVDGIFDRTVSIVAKARALGIPIQINTTVVPANVDQIDAIAEMIDPWDIELWSAFFLVNVGRGITGQRVEPEQYERVFEKLWHHAQTKSFAVKTTEAHHYRRYVIQRSGDPQMGRAPIGIRDGNGVMFISHTGKVYPSGFLPKQAGQFPDESVVAIYRDSPIFTELRDWKLLTGKCRRCEFNRVCGGSRSRAFAVSGDYMAEEPDCVYQPIGRHAKSATD